MKRYGSKKSLLLVAVFLVGGYVPQVFATPDPDIEKRWFAGIGVSATDLTFNEANLSAMYTGGPGASFRQGGDTFKLFAGYQFDPLLGVEVGVTSFGEIVMESNVNQRNVFTANAAYVDAVVTFPLMKNIDFQSKLGMSFWSLVDNNEKEIEAGQGLTYGAGVNIDLIWQRYANVVN